MTRFATRLIFLLSALFLLTITFNGITATVKGIVFEDKNHNLKMDKDEPGIPGVAVSNQADVVATGDGTTWHWGRCAAVVSGGV